ncbi:MAG: UMP kinase [Candidatus Nealsonbacteria bacterium]
MPQKTIVLSLGGSIIVQDEIQTKFLKDFRKFILKFIKNGHRFIIVVGGGKICRKYQQAASEIADVNDEDKDWIGIHATRLNAHLIRTIFRKQAYSTVLDSPLKPINQADFKHYRLFIASGWKPGWSTDYDAVVLAKRFGASTVINASNVEYVYDKNPVQFKAAKPLREIAWPDYLKIIGKKWLPGMNTPFDPIASQFAQKSKMTVIFAKGTDLKNLADIIRGKNFNGTTIHP